MDFIFGERFKNVFIIFLLIVILGLGSYVLFFKEECVDKYESNDILLVEEEVEVSKEEMNEELVSNEKYYVDIKGAVKKPGVYEINKGSIVNDVIKMAGGLKSSASTKYINLSYELKNHDVINIYTINEVKKDVVKTECVCPEIEISSCDNSSIISSSGEVKQDSDKSEEIVSNKVNINTATKEELLTLNGIGESKALAIIEYRNSNKFNSIEDLMNVSGIGESLYNKIKDSITV